MAADRILDARTNYMEICLDFTSFHKNQGFGIGDLQEFLHFSGIKNPVAVGVEATNQLHNVRLLSQIRFVLCDDRHQFSL